MKPQRQPVKRNPIARALASKLYAARIVPARKGRGAQPKRQNNRRNADFSY